jgi:integrase
MSIKVRGRKLQNGRISLYLDINHGGERITETLGLILEKPLTPQIKASNKEMKLKANDIAYKRNLDISLGKHGFKPEYRSEVSLAEYLRTISKEKKAPATSGGWISTIAWIVKFNDTTNMMVQDVTEEWLNDFKRYLLKNVSNNSAAVYFSKVVAGLNQAKRTKLIAENPAEYVRSIKIIRKRKEFLTEEEINKLSTIKCGSHVLKRAFLFAILTGMRVYDIKKLTYNDIKNDAQSSHYIVYTQQKTHGLEYLPIKNQVLELIGKGKPSDKIFPKLQERLQNSVI